MGVAPESTFNNFAVEFRNEWLENVAFGHDRRSSGGAGV
jgi:hypothetical protein